MRARFARRRGVSMVQWCLIAAALVMAVIAGVTLVGGNANTKLNQTATDMANPKNLTTRFGS
jgi:Flp pilus assembly pilin Flp